MCKLNQFGIILFLDIIWVVASKILQLNRNQSVCYTSIKKKNRNWNSIHGVSYKQGTTLCLYSQSCTFWSLFPQWQWMGVSYVPNKMAKPQIPNFIKQNKPQNGEVVTAIAQVLCTFLKRKCNCLGNIWYNWLSEPFSKFGSYLQRQ